MFQNRIKQFLTSQAAIVATVIIFTSLAAVAAFAAQDYYLRATNDISTFPRPRFDTGIGIHWDASAQSNDITSAQNNVCSLKEVGISWIKIAVNGDSTVEFVEVMKQNDIEPIIRLARPRMNPGRISTSDMESIKDYIDVGASYFEINNEPNLADEWNGLPLPCSNVAVKTMENWTKDAVVVQQKGGHPVFPGLAPTEDGDKSCEDGQFVRNSFEWLKSNQCQLANGSTGSCLDIFDSNKSNGKGAVMNVHNYSLNNDQGGDIGGNEGFGLFRKYDEIVKSFLGRSVPILATEGGPTIADNSVPNNNPNAHRKIAVASVEHQMNNATPYFFNTAFWVSHYTGSGDDPGAKPQSWFNWSAENKLRPSDTFGQTINALKAITKKSRNGTPAPSGCSGGTNPSPTPAGNPSPTSIASCPTGNPKPTPNPLACDSGIGNKPDFALSKNVTLKENMDFWIPFTFENAEVNHNTGGYTPFGPNILITGSGNFVGGFYQTIDKLKPGTWYQAFYTTAQKMRGTNGKIDGGKATLREVGIDPTGGTDWKSSNVIWGRNVGGNNENYGGWKTVEVGNSPLVSVKATGTKATMFVKVSGSADNGGSETWINSPFYIEACDEGNFDDSSTVAPSCTPSTGPTSSPTGSGGSPTPTKPLPVGTCSVTLASRDETNAGYNVVKLNFSGKGGEVILQMGQKGSTGTEIGNAYNVNGFFSPNFVQGMSTADQGKRTGQTPGGSGRMPPSGSFTSDSVFYKLPDSTVFKPTEFTMYEWDKKFKKNPAISNTSTNLLDFNLGKGTAWWYFIDFCDGRTALCTRNNIEVKIPKEKSAFFFCSVKDQSPVCIGNPICSYNDGPDVGAKPDIACPAWKQSCSTTDFVKYEQGVEPRGNGGININSFTPAPTQ